MDYEKYSKLRAVRKASANYLWIDLLKNNFLFDKGQKHFTNRKDAEAHLISKHGVTPDVAKRVIDQGAIAGGFNLNVLLDE